MSTTAPDQEPEPAPTAELGGTTPPAEKTPAIGTKRKARRPKDTSKSSEPKFEWTDELIRAMLRLRFSNATIVKRFLDADTNPKKDAFWCLFAAVLTTETGVVVSTKRLRDKYKKVKYEYRAYTEDVGRTGNQELKSKPPRYLPILQEWFGNKTGAGNGIMFDSNESDKDTDDEATGDREPEPKKPFKTEGEQKGKQGVNLLAHEMGRGMEAIADAFKHAQPAQDITGLFRSAQEENRSLMERMMQAQERHNELILQLINAIAHKK